MKAVILAVLTIIVMGDFIRQVGMRLRIVCKAPGKFSFDNASLRIWRFFSEVLFQSKVIKGRPLAGLMHSFVFWGFLTFVIITLNHFSGGFGWRFLGEGIVFRIISTIVAAFALLVIVGIIALAFRRFFLQPEALGKHLSWSSGLVALFILILMVTYLLDLYLFEEGTVNYAVNWWIHSVVILAFVSLIIRSKHLHLVLSPFTVYLKDFHLARIKPLDFEKEEMGAEKLSDLAKHTALGAFTCVECGRCFDHCPARNTGKVLDPKQWMLDIRAGLLKNPEMEDPSEMLNFDMIWQCTTCGACTYQCPVGIDQVIPIIEFRRGFVSGGEFPSTMRPLFDNLERSGNPWKYQPDEAADFIEENGIPWYKEQETVYWMGCMGRYDAYYRKASAAFAEVLRAAGVDYGVLKEEKCTGDAARRAGNEFLFQMLAEENIAVLNETKAKTLVTTCPHCLRTLEEYRDMGLRSDLVIVHHSTYILGLINAGKLRLSGGNGAAAVYHDACYLSRYRAPAGSKEPRRVLAASGVKVSEAKRHGDASFCCGAGGGMLFTEETEGKRINHERFEEITSGGAKTIAASCPFCQIMFRDAMTAKDVEDVEVKDLAQFVKDRIEK